MSDVKLGENWTERDHQKSLGTGRRRRNKKFLVAMIESRPEAEWPEFVLGSMPELAEIVFESFPQC